MLCACGGGGGTGPATGTLQGLVRDTAGAALEQVLVQLRDSVTSTNLGSVYTDAGGAYSFPGTSTGGFTVFVQVPPATQVVGTNPIPATVTGSQTTQADFSLRLLPVSFSSHVQPVFTASCASGGCHAGAAPKQGMDLSSGNAYANIVNVAAVEPTPSMDRIEPGDPTLSFMIHKLEGTQGGLVCSPVPPGCGTRMPQGAPPLPLQTIRMIKRWVTAGALNN